VFQGVGLKVLGTGAFLETLQLCILIEKLDGTDQKAHACFPYNWAREDQSYGKLIENLQ